MFVSNTVQGVSLLHIPEHICQFMVKAKVERLVAATNDVPVHVIASPAISPTLSQVLEDVSFCTEK